MLPCQSEHRVSGLSFTITFCRVLFNTFLDMHRIPVPLRPVFSTKNNRCLSGLRLTPTRVQPGRTIKTNAWHAIQLRKAGLSSRQGLCHQVLPPPNPPPSLYISVCQSVSYFVPFLNSCLPLSLYTLNLKLFFFSNTPHTHHYCVD